MVDRPTQWLPAQGGVNAVQLRDEIAGQGGAAIIVPASIGEANVKIGGFRQVPVCAQMLNSAHVAALLRLKNIARVSAKELPRSFQKNAFWGGQDALDGKTCIVDSVFPAD